MKTFIRLIAIAAMTAALCAYQRATDIKPHYSPPDGLTMTENYAPGIRTEVTDQWLDPVHMTAAYTVRMVNDTDAPLTVSCSKVTLLRDGYRQELDSRKFTSVTVEPGDIADITGTVSDSETQDPDATYTVKVTAVGNEGPGSAEVNEPRSGPMTIPPSGRGAFN